MTDPRSSSFSCRPADARRKWVTASPTASVFKGITLGAGTPGTYWACSRSASGCISMASSVGSMRLLHRMKPMSGVIKHVAMWIYPTSPSGETGIFHADLSGGDEELVDAALTRCRAVFDVSARGSPPL